MHGKGTLTVETCLVPPQTPTTLEHATTDKQDIPGESRVSVKITDTGPGIPKDIQDKIFDPYFTTKDQGEGSGLGLGIARQIVERHHGEIRFTSKPGETSFEVLLPISGVQDDYLAQ
jgi:signal transduction histidine kinase